MTLGLHGKLTPDEARKKAAKLLAAVADGSDPAAERAETKKALTITELADLYYVEGPAEKPNKKGSSWQADRSNIERHIKPLLGRRIVRTLTTPDVARFQAEVSAGKSKADVKTGNRGARNCRGWQRDGRPLTRSPRRHAPVRRRPADNLDQSGKGREAFEGRTQRALPY
jgi:hypothetical protein